MIIGKCYFYRVLTFKSCFNAYFYLKFTYYMKSIIRKMNVKSEFEMTFEEEN